MSVSNKEILEKANQAISRGDYENFLSFCADDSSWVFAGDKTLKGISAIRQYMQSEYLEPPVFDVENVIAEGNNVVAIGKISIKQADGGWKTFEYCDIWDFKEGKMFALKAFVI